MKLNLRILFSKPSSAQEAMEKQNTAKLLALGCLAVAILFTVLGALISLSLLESLGMIFIVLAAACFYLWYRAKAEATRMKTVFCDCGEKFAYPENVTYTVTGEQVSSGKDPNNDNIIQHKNTKVTLQCKCQKCGKERTVDTAFVTERSVLNKRGVLLTTKEYPIEGQLVNFFK